ncbi:MAG: hypothetical protein HYX48_00260 [Chlamydiales bacterium]|nr:hypothetical protein [Chlamydiales bacterium]
MQFYALDGDFPILATHAQRHEEYRCPECKGAVRLRKGAHRQPHFYHPTVPALCLQHKKSLTHLRIQWIIQALFPSGEARMERPFPEIGRIADVAWERGKIVFEIQYSPISLQEARSRCADYRSIGYTPIWILHEKQFNKRKICAAEQLLRKTGAYYTNIDEKGHGEIFDQFDICLRGRRLFSGPRLKVNVKEPIRFSPHLIKGKEAPKALLSREGPLYFSGDLLDHFAKGDASSMLEMERRILRAPSKPTLLSEIRRFYQIFFGAALEKSCR